MSSVSGSICRNLPVAGLSSSVAVNVFWPILTCSFTLMACAPGRGGSAACAAGLARCNSSPTSQEHRMLNVTAAMNAISRTERICAPPARLLECFGEEAREPVERDQVHPVVQVHMSRIRDDQQFFRLGRSLVRV